MYDRIIALIDMDCFYVQVEQKLNPELQNQPCVVVQKTWKGGSIIAVNYEARACGVTRGAFGSDAQSKCPDLKLARVPEVRGKSDLTRYRDGSKEVFSVLTQFTNLVEKASIDEAFLDITDMVEQRMTGEFQNRPVTLNDLPTSCVIVEGDEDEDKRGILEKWLTDAYKENILDNSNHQLAVAAVVVEEIRAKVLSETTYKCSAGIACNKMLAKYICGLHKPNRQTVLPQTSLPYLFAKLPLTKIRNLGGKLGAILVDEFKCNTMADLGRITSKRLEERFAEKTGKWLYDLGKGIDMDPVNPRQVVKSIGCSKHFFGKSALKSKDDVKHWLMQFAEEIVERGLVDQEENKRMARTLTVSAQLRTVNQPHITRSCPITVYDISKLCHDAYVLLQKFNKANDASTEWNPAILVMSMSISKFQDMLQSSVNLHNFFKQSTATANQDHEASTSTNQTCTLSTPSKSHQNDRIVKQKLNFFVPKPQATSSSSNYDTGQKSTKKGFFETKLQNEASATKTRSENVQPINTLVMNDVDKSSLSELPFDIQAEIMDTGQQSNRGKNVEKSKSKTELEKYLESSSKDKIKFSSDPPKVSSTTNEGTYLCNECNQSIPMEEVFNHQDFHYACKLQSDMDNESNAQVSSTVTSSKNVKRKKSSQPKHTAKKKGAIDRYFSAM